jgi:hypothetical protein
MLLDAIHEVMPSCIDQPTIRLECSSNLAIETVNHGRQINLAGRDLEFRDAGEPFFIWAAVLMSWLTGFLVRGAPFPWSKSRNATDYMGFLSQTKWCLPRRL